MSIYDSLESAARYWKACEGVAIAELQRDAERYRWLKANHLQTGPDSWIRTGDDLEEAIDAAMEECRTATKGQSVERERDANSAREEA